MAQPVTGFGDGTRGQERGRPRRWRVQSVIGVELATLIVAGWTAVHVSALYLIAWTPGRLPAMPLAIALQAWLSVGLFIVSHDCMHGSLAPGRPAFNRWFGRLALLLYAGFAYDRLLPKHLSHHRAPGTDADPDFDADHPDSFWRWYRAFLGRYFGWWEFCVTGTIVVAYVALLQPALWKVPTFYMLPAILASMQLFYFGTYLPHRGDRARFADGHRSRSNEYGWLTSLLTCFHFGYHHEHHLSPGTPWWALPAFRRSRHGGRDTSTVVGRGAAA